MAGQKPLIGVTGPETGARSARFFIALGLRLAGAKVEQLRPSHQIPARRLDGIVISGGHDVEPVLYKSAAEVEGNYDPERDEFESDMINKALASNIPLLGICRGAQLLNVCLGGDLIQDLQKAQPDTRRRRTILPVKSIRIDDDSIIAKETGARQLRINSLHNQSMDRLGVGLVVRARDQREVIQYVENPDAPFLVGVQWHPEYLLYLSASRKLFRALTRAARETAGDNAAS